MPPRSAAACNDEYPSATAAHDCMAVLDRIVQGKLNVSKYAEAQTTLEDWNLGLREKRRLGIRPTVLEHTVLVFALRSSRSANRALAFSLNDSWLALTGSIPQNPLQRLPRYVLRGQSHETRLFHAAAFQNLSPPRAKDARREAALGRDFVGNPRDLFFGLSMVAVLLYPAGRELLAGLGLGYLIATTLEYGFHGSLAHAPKAVNRFFAWIGGKTEKEFQELKFSHVGIHHDRTFKARYCVQFASKEAKSEVEKLARTRSPQAARDILDSGFGNSMSRRGAGKGLKVGVPFALAVTAFVHWASIQVGLQPGLLFDASALLLSLLNLPATGFFHAYMHMTREEAQAKAPPLMRWFLGTRYTAMMSRLHYGHHRGRGGNYNLVFGADALFGALRKPTIKQLLEMKKLNLIY